MEGCYKRTVDDVKNMLIYAKQNESEVNQLTQIFYYPSELTCREIKQDFRLLEVDEEFIKKLESGERLIFKGENDEKVVLCTENETYEVKEGEISNSLVLCPDLQYRNDVNKSNEKERILKEKKVFGVYHNYLQLRLTYPKLSKLHSILKETYYCGPNEDKQVNEGYYFGELLDAVQCSKNELLLALKEVKALCLEDKWRLLSLNYITEVFSYIISLMEKQTWKEIHALETIQILKPVVPEFVINHILEHYATQHVEDENLYDFIGDLVSQCFAEVLLKTAEGKFRFDEFMMAWEQCLAPVIEADLKCLKGLALIEKGEGQQKVIHLFGEKDLPENVQERFRLLFKRKEKWSLDEISPYIEKLATKSMSVNAMLTKYARVSTVKGIRVFSARYAK